MKKYVTRLLSLVFVLLLLVAPCSMEASAAETPQTLKVYVQYWADADPVLLGEYTRSELDGLAASSKYGYEGYYCNVTRVCTVLRIHAKGIKLKEFLQDYVGVDLASVRQIDFHTTDISASERFVSKGRWELLDSTRYYYPNLVANSHIDYDLYKRIVDNAELASEGVVVVPTLLATYQVATKDPSADITKLTMVTNDTFRLCSGDPDTLVDGMSLTWTSNESAKWVDAIYVVLSGSAPEETTTSKKTDESTTIGSKTQKSEKTTKKVDTTKKVETGTETTTLADAGVTSKEISGSSYSEVKVSGSGSVINWKEESDDSTVALQKSESSTAGYLYAGVFMGSSLLVGAVAMFIWFKKEV